MTGINHILTGGLIGAAVASPLALPLAFVSHFALDAMPHFGVNLSEEKGPLSKVWVVDATLIAGLVIVMLLTNFENKGWIAAGGVAAVSPDFMWIYNFTVKERFGTRDQVVSTHWFNKMHARIQTMEWRTGLFIEVPVFLALAWVFSGRVL